MSKPLLHRLPSTGKYDKKYRVHGHDHLTVEAYYSEAEFGYWWVRDNRFTALDRYRRETVFTATYLSDIRSWVKAGGASLWDPEKRKADKNWKPIPDGWDFGDERMEAKRLTPFKPFGEKGSIASRAVARDAAPARRPTKEPNDYPLFPRSLAGKKYAVVPGWIRSVNDGQRHWIGFGALTWLYGVKPSECVLVENENERGWDDDARAHLIWLRPQRHYRDYESMKEELARGEDAFKLVEP